MAMDLLALSCGPLGVSGPQFENLCYIYVCGNREKEGKKTLSKTVFFKYDFA